MKIMFEENHFSRGVQDENLELRRGGKKRKRKARKSNPGLDLGLANDPESVDQQALDFGTEKGTDQGDQERVRLLGIVQTMPDCGSSYISKMCSW